jgi:hypothetical protein
VVREVGLTVAEACWLLSVPVSAGRGAGNRRGRWGRRAGKTKDFCLSALDTAWAERRAAIVAAAKVDGASHEELAALAGVKATAIPMLLHRLKEAGYRLPDGRKRKENR